jgi:hypothetical protein
MKLDNRILILDQNEVAILNTVIIELGGPLHSSAAKKLQSYYDEYDQICKTLMQNSALEVNNLKLVTSVLQVFRRNSRF